MGCLQTAPGEAAAEPTELPGKEAGGGRQSAPGPAWLCLGKPEAGRQGGKAALQAGRSAATRVALRQCCSHHGEHPRPAGTPCPLPCCWGPRALLQMPPRDDSFPQLVSNLPEQAKCLLGERGMTPLQHGAPSSFLAGARWGQPACTHQRYEKPAQILLQGVVGT